MPNAGPGHVELSLRSLRINFFNGRDFHDLDDLKAQLARWSTSIDDERPQRRKQHRTPLELHAEEQPHLVAGRAMSTTPREWCIGCATWRASWRGTVAATRRYSLPAENDTELLPVREDP